MPAIGRADVKTITCVGIGVIGASWASFFLSRGFRVRATDVDRTAFDRALPAIATSMADLGDLGPIADDWQSRLHFEGDLEAAVHGADFIQENGPEQLPLKCAVFEKLDRFAPPDVVIASSTSGIPMSRIQDACRHPQRCVVGHPFTPVHLIPLVEVAGGHATDPSAVAWALGFYRSIGKKVAHVRKDVPGFIVNRFQTLVLQEALSLVKNGVATVAEIDEAFINGPGLRWALYGPFALTAFSAGEEGLGVALRRYKSHRDNVLASITPVDVDESLIETVAEQVDALSRSTTPQEALRKRDRCLVKLLQAI
ncbi:MAG: 3-hydroxyacyl-CoA dehydrogenase family protein [Parvibaculaceae bacterium]